MSNELIKRLEKIGEGSYGIVYSGKYINSIQKKAIKRNYKENTASWIGNIREADVLVRLKGHPCIVEIDKISVGDPFTSDKPMTPTVVSKKDMSEDKIHFILEHMDTAGDDYTHSPKFSFSNSRLILLQILIALEYMHSKKIIHRDLKPANVLIKFEDGIPYAKICDFGMSCYHNKCNPTTPGVVTCWYRAPEICYGHPDYDFKSDIWSYGCLLFEFIAKKPWIFNIKDDDTKIMNEIVSRLDLPPLLDDMKYLESKRAKNLYVNTNDIMRGKRMSYESQIRFRGTDKQDFMNQCGGEESLKDFYDILGKCLQINPNKRPTATELLTHKFFSVYQGLVQEIKTSFVCIPDNEQIIINQSRERAWAMNFALEIYNKRKTIKWYSHMIFFHAIDLFDRYLYWVNGPDNYKIKIYSDETFERGKIHTQKECELRMLVCLYIMHKYYATLEHPKTWENFYDCEHIRQEREREAENYEYIVIKNVCNYKIFRNTFIEMIDKYNDFYNDDIIDKLVRHLLKTNNYIGGIDALYFNAKNQKV